jgi:hypothetical protein
MAKRFMSTDIWDEDWFLDMPNEYKLFWFYVLSSCDHAGIFKVNLRSFCGLNGIKLTSEDALIYFNTGKDRIMELSKNTWFIMDFFSFQYGTTFNENNRLHASIKIIYEKHNIDINKVRGLKDLKEKTKSGLEDDQYGVKDKDKDKDKDIVKLNRNKNGKFSGNFKAQGEELYVARIERDRNENDSSRKADIWGEA